MKKKENNVVKANVASGMSSAIGAAAGVLAGSLFSNDLHAAEVTEVHPVEEDVEVVTIEDHPITEPETEDVQVINSGPTQPNDSITPEVDVQEEPRFQVLSYETLLTDDGSEVDVALVDIDGQVVAFGDMNQDGIADIAFSDLNGNNIPDPGEMEDVSAWGIPMNTLHDAVYDSGSHLTAQTADIDYTNDANVDAYYA